MSIPEDSNLHEINGLALCQIAGCTEIFFPQFLQVNATFKYIIHICQVNISFDHNIRFVSG